MEVQSPLDECNLEKEDPLRILLEGTATVTGERFFEMLVMNLARALNTKHAWITEYIPDRRRLKALAFWVDGVMEPDFEVDIDDTPCEAVIEKAQLVHYPDDIRELFPRSAKLKELGAVSYMGVPLMDLNGSILGHLAVIDDRPMPDEPQRLILFKIFAARAAAELQRIRAESEAKDREEKLSRLVSSAMDAIIELDNEFNIVLLNPAAEKLLKDRLHEKDGKNFLKFLNDNSRRKFKKLMGMLRFHGPGEKYSRVPGGFEVIDYDGSQVSTDATISQFELRGRSYYTLILRNIAERVNAERKIRILYEETSYLRDEIKALGNFNDIVG
jgi:PAS domain S-box-containing protein